MPDDAQLRYLARRRLGVVGSRALEQAGFGASSVYRRVKSGTLRRVLPGIYILDGYPIGPDARALAAIEWAGKVSVASHRCCARLFHLEDAPDVVEITTTQKKGGAPSWLKLHHVREIASCDATRIGIVPVTTPTRMLIDAGSCVSDEVLETWLDQALREGKTTIRRLNEALERLGGKGRRGVGALRRLLKDRDPSSAPNESRLETRLARILRRAGLPAVEAQKVLYDGGGYVGRIDFVFPEIKLVVEAHSYKYHSSRRAWELDVQRWNRLRRDGWRVVLVTWRDVMSAPDAVVQDILSELSKDRLFVP